MAKRPRERYSDCSELGEDLRRWLDGEPIRARRLGVVERAGRWARRNPDRSARQQRTAQFGPLGIRKPLNLFKNLDHGICHRASTRRVRASPTIAHPTCELRVL